MPTLGHHVPVERVGWKVDAVNLSAMQELFDEASPEAAHLVCTILRQDRDYRLWNSQIGPALTQRQIASHDVVEVRV